MNNINFNMQSINRYCEDQSVILEQSDISKLNSIFEKCDIEDEQGTKKPDGKLTNGEVPNFIKMISQQLPKLTNVLLKFQDYISGNKSNQIAQSSQQVENPAFQEVENKLNLVEQEQFQKNLQKAKDIISENSNILGLTNDEINFIQNASIKAENNDGAARKASNTELIFNYNSLNGVPDVGSIVKIMIHEATHMSLNTKNNTQNEERQCETRAIKASLKLIQNGKMEHFTIMASSNGYITTEDFINEQNDEKLNKCINYWIAQGYSHIPEQ